MSKELETISDSEISEFTENETTFFVKHGMTYAGENLLELAKEGGNISADIKKPVYQYIFGFIGYKFESVEREDGEPFESVVFLTPEGRHLSTTAQVVKNVIKEQLEQSPFIMKDEAGNFIMKDGFILTTETIYPTAFTYYEKRGNHGGYAKLL
jgi:hypothetical protein